MSFRSVPPPANVPNRGISQLMGNSPQAGGPASRTMVPQRSPLNMASQAPVPSSRTMAPQSSPFSMTTQAPPADVDNPGVEDFIEDTDVIDEPSTSDAPPYAGQPVTQLQRDATAEPLTTDEQSYAGQPVTQLRRDAFSASQAPRMQSTRRPSGTTQLPSSQASQMRIQAITKSAQPDIVTRLKRDPTTQNSRMRSPTQAYNVTQLRRDQTSMPAIDETSIPASIPTTIVTPPELIPAAAKSVLRTKHDMVMASRQSSYSQMNTTQRQEQDQWAKEKISETPDSCPQKYGYSRRGDGYVCGGGSHFITDDLLAEGRGGMYAIKDAHDWKNRSEGPYYLARQDPDGTLWFYNPNKQRKN